MSIPLALTLVGVLLALATVLGAVLRTRDGRRRSGGYQRVDRADIALTDLGSRATLVQFSTQICARCPQVRRMLNEYVNRDDRLRHVEIDLTNRPDLSARYQVLQTPTTFLVDASGVVRSRFNGVPRTHALEEALAAVAV